MSDFLTRKGKGQSPLKQETLLATRGIPCPFRHGEDVKLTTFGTFWTVEGFQVAWPLADAFLLVLAAIYLLASLAIVQWLKGVKRQQLATAKANTTD